MEYAILLGGLFDRTLLFSNQGIKALTLTQPILVHTIHLPTCPVLTSHPSPLGHMVAAGRWRNLDVAVKTVLFTARKGDSELNALMEAAVCSCVEHPNVVTTYHYEVTEVKSRPGDGGNLIVEHSSATADYKLYLVQVGENKGEGEMAREGVCRGFVAVNTTDVVGPG